MRPVLFTILGYPIRSYGFFIAIAVFAGILFAKWLNRRRRPQYVPLIEEFVTTAMLAAIAGARLWEVAFTWDYYRENLWEITAIWHGGLSIQGAVMGGLIAAAWFARSRKLVFLDFVDSLTPALLLGQAIGRIGACFLNGDAYGKPTGSTFGVIYAPGSMAFETFGPVPLWPAELFEGAWDLAVMAFTVWLLRKEHRPGVVFSWYVLLYSVGRFGLEFLRADSLQFYGFKSAQVTSVLFFVIAAIALYRFRTRSSNQLS